MIKDRYEFKFEITLYNTVRFDEFLTYRFPVLPEKGDMILVCEGVLFEVQLRCFPPRQEGMNTPVTLHGIIVNGDNKGQHSWEKLKEKILDEREGITRNREGMVERREFTGFPDTLD
jgi:hypothetical protein